MSTNFKSVLREICSIETNSIINYVFIIENEMPTAVVRDAYDSQEEGALYLEKKDQVIVIENT